MSGNPFFSVVLPNFNHGCYLKDAIDSVINQDYKNWELLIIDNYSTDNSNDVISSYNDSRIRVFKIKNEGIIAKSRNLGIKNAQAKWIAFLDSDDIWYFNKLSKLIELTDDNFDIICSNEYRHDLAEGIRKPLCYNLKSNNFYQELLLKGNALSTSATIVSRDFLNNNKLGFSENVDFITVEDYDFWMQIALKNGSFGFCKEFLGEFRIHGRNNSNNFKLHGNNLIKLLKNHVYKIQDFSEKDKLWDKIKPRLTLMFIKNHFEINFINGFKYLVHKLMNSKLRDLNNLIVLIISKATR
jgi:glycosyltransferase involved in cell wall biosynthesis